MRFSLKLAAMSSVAVLLTAALPPLAAQSSLPAASATDNQDTVFLALRDAARRDDAQKAQALAERLPDYGIPSYVEYYRIKPRIRQLPVEEIRAFLQRYQGSAIADRLRNDWLLEIGKARDWATFDVQYPQFVLDDDLQLKCYALMSKEQKGVAVGDDARALLVSPKDYGEGCFSLMTMLAVDKQWNVDDMWAQIRLSAENNVSFTARRAAAFTDAPENLVVQAIDKPGLVLARGPGLSRAGHEVFIVALGRAAKNNPEQAVAALVGAGTQLTPPEQALGWAQIALQASLKLMPEAVDYWRRANGAPLSAEGHQWKVRTALRAGDWKLVRSGIEAMPATLRDDAAWVYWLGRALKSEGLTEDAQARFQSLAAQTGFYGQLSTEELGGQIAITSRPQPLTPQEVTEASANAGFQRAMKFFDLGLRFEAVREWNWELRGMSDRQLLAAAEFARQRNVLDRMVNTSDRTKVELDFTQRFPSPYRDIMQANTQTLGLDMAWVYGLIRQESRFIMNARSHVGASGLMQIMPATAKYVARRIGVYDFTQDRINDINMNILLGTNYLSMVLNDLDGSQALASAAYNAGPGRPRAWRATLTRPVEGAVFAESIPFNETRGYVKNVLSNATWYAALFENRPQSLKARLGKIMPKGYVATDLP